MKAFPIVVVLLAVAALLVAVPAHADDEPFSIQADGGSTVTPLDGGVTVTADLGSHGSCYNMAIRCDVQGARYSLCTTVPCLVTASNTWIDADRLWDIPVNCNANVSTNGPKRYLSLATDDAGVPSCRVQHSPF